MTGVNIVKNEVIKKQNKNKAMGIKGILQLI
jgi:hypothetical protein